MLRERAKEHMCQFPIHPMMNNMRRVQIWSIYRAIFLKQIGLYAPLTAFYAENHIERIYKDVLPCSAGTICNTVISPKLLTVLQLIRFVIISAYLPYNLISLIMS